jgi:hypothetical protein
MSSAGATIEAVFEAAFSRTRRPLLLPLDAKKTARVTIDLSKLE